MLNTYIKHTIVDSTIRAVFDGIIANFKRVDVNSLTIGKTYALIRVAISSDVISSDVWKYCIHDYTDVLITAYDGVKYSANCSMHYYIYTDDTTLYRRNDVLLSWNLSFDSRINIVPNEIILIEDRD